VLVKKTILLLLASLAAAALPGSVSGQVDLVSRTIWRGFDLLHDNHAAIQPGFTVDFGDSGFALNVWSSFALSDRGVLKEADEIDLTFSYAWAMAPGWEVTAGLIGYGYGFARGFSISNDTSLEAFATVAGTGLPLTPTLSAYYDFNLGSGFYISLGGSHEIEVNEEVRLELGGLIGFNGGQYIERSAFSNIDIYARMALTIGKLTLTPSLNVMVPLLDEVNEEIEIWFGLSVGI
jgi:hypothetical protein